MPVLLALLLATSSASPWISTSSSSSSSSMTMLAAAKKPKPPPVVEPPIVEAPPTPPTPPPQVTTTTTTTERRIIRIAVGDFTVSDIDPRVGRVVADNLVFELRKLERTNVISFEEVRRMLDLEAEKQTLGCSSDTSCLAQVADALGVDYLVTGTLAKVGDTHVFGLQLLNQGAASSEGSVNKVMPAGSGVEFLGEIGPAVATLFPDVPLRVGETRGISEEQARRLTPPPLSPWIFGATVTTSGLLLVGAGAAAIVQVIAQSDYDRTANDAKTSTQPGSTIVALGQRAQTAEFVGWGLLGGGIVVAGLALAMAPLTDFEGLGAEQ